MSKRKKNSRINLDVWMYLLQNELIDVLKRKGASKERLAVENLIGRISDIKPELNKEKLNKLYDNTKEVIENIKTSDDVVSNHIEFLTDYTRKIIRNQDADKTKKDYQSSMNKNNEIYDYENNILNNQNEKKKYYKEKEKFQKNLAILSEYVSENRARLSKNPKETNNIRKQIQRTKNSIERVDHMIGILDSSIYQNQRAIEELKYSATSEAIVGTRINIEKTTERIARTKTNLDKIRDTEKGLDALDNRENEDLETFNQEEDIQYLEDFANVHQEKKLDETEKKNEKERSFEELMNSLEK